VSYKPAANFCTTLASAQFATDTFTYTLSPAAVAPLNPASSTATVTVTVNCVDDNPVAVADTFTGANAATEDTAKILTVLTNDTDVDCAPFAGGLCGPIKITNVTQPANGTVQISVGQDTLTYTPNANYCNGDNPAMESFMYTLNGGSTTIVSVGVVCVNDPPQFTKGADQTVLEDAGAQTVVGWATNISAGPNEPGQTVVFQVIGDSNPTLFTSLPAVGPTGTLTYTPAADANGIAVITIRAQDNGGGNDTSSPQTFQITVTPVNDAPSFTGGGPVSSTGITPFSAGWATAFSAGPANESGQAVAHYNLALSSTTGNLGFAAGPAIDVAGNLTYTPTEGTNGSATYAVTVTDNGGTANGGVDTSAAQTLVITVGKATQTVAITSFPPANAAVNSTYVVTATATSGLAVSLSIDASTASNCSISGSTVTFLSANPCTIDANQAGDGSWFAAPQAQQTVGVGQAGQTITFTSTAPGAAVVNGATYTATATATSGLTVNITVDATSSTVCSIAGAVVSFIGAGTCTLDANQSGNANFNPAPQVQQSFAVAKGNQTIAFTSTAPVGETVGGPTYSVSATATSNLPVTITIDAASASICSIAGNTVSFNAFGICLVDANQAGNGNFNAAPQVQQSIAVAKGNQAISFTSSIPTNATVNQTYSVTATASSGLTVVFTLDGTTTPGACSLVGNLVTFLTAGNCVIDANQPGNANFNAAPQVQQGFGISKATQTVSFTSNAPVGAVVGTVFVAPTAAASPSGLPVVLSVDASSANVCTLTGSTSGSPVAFIHVGTCVLDANQPGNASYLAAAQVQQSFAVGKNNQSITVTSTAPSTAVVGAQYTATATANSGLAVTITVSGACSILGSVVTFGQTTGTCTIKFDQAGNADWNAAAQQTQSVTVRTNTRPVLSDSTNTVFYHFANGPAVALDPTLVLTDDGSLVGASVDITSTFRAGDTLNFVNQSLITGSYDTTTHILTLTGTDTPANYQAALRSVTFTSSNTSSTTSRTVVFQVTDDGGLTANTPLSITVTNDTTGPAFTGNPQCGNGNVSYSRSNGTPVFVCPNADPDDSGLIATITVTITNGSPLDVLAFTIPNGSGITSTFSGGVLTLTGIATTSLTNWDDAVRSVTFKTTATTNGASRTVTFVATDSAGNVSSPVTRTVVVNP
jgi:hypothetical protein